MNKTILVPKVFSERSTRMKIDIIVTQYEAGGAQKAAVNLANGLVNKGYSIRLIFLYKKSDISFWIDADVEVEFLQNNSSFAKKIVYTPFKLSRLWIKQRPDVILAFTHYANIISALCARFLNIPVVVSHRNPYSSYSMSVRFIDRMLYRMDFYSAITYVSRSTRKSFGMYPEKNIPHYVIHNCTGIFDTQKYGINNINSDYIVSVGRLTSQKNHSLLIRTLAKSSYKGDLIIIGEGPMKTTLMDLCTELKVTDRVKFMGVVGNQEIHTIIKNAKAFVMPSLYEGMSNALLEAIASGVYTIVSDIPAQREVVEIEGKYYGSIIDLNNEMEWIEIFNQIDQGLQIDEEMRQKLKERFSCTQFIDHFNRLCEEFLL